MKNDMDEKDDEIAGLRQELTASEPLDPWAQLHLPRPGAARLLDHVQIALCDRLGIEVAVGSHVGTPTNFAESCAIFPTSPRHCAAARDSTGSLPQNARPSLTSAG